MLYRRADPASRTPALEPGRRECWTRSEPSSTVCSDDRWGMPGMAGTGAAGVPARASVVPDELCRIARLAQVTEAVRDQIIPRLLARERGADRLAADTVRFASLVVRASPREADAFVARLRLDGMPAALLCTGLLAGTARLLGEQWARDEVSFADVTLGTARLQRLLRTLAPTLERKPGPVGGVAVLFAAVPGSQHRFGLAMMAEFFRAEGWRVQIGLYDDADQLEVALRDGRHDLLGLSIAIDAQLPMLRECCARARALPAGRRLALMAGGPLLIGRPDLAAELDVDATAVDPAEALVAAERLVSSGEPAQANFG